jgi:chitinase
MPFQISTLTLEKCKCFPISSTPGWILVPNIVLRSLTDIWADTEILFAGDSLGIGNNLYGCLKQLYLLKKQRRSLKTLLSIGGWTYSQNFALPASTSAGRSTFASSAVALVQTLGLDGLDIDWEYPEDDAQAENMVLLLQAVRAALDTYGNSFDTPYHFELTVASPCGPSNYRQMNLSGMDPYVDFWNLMAYDYAGSWSLAAGDQANLFVSINNSAATPFDTMTTVNYYISQGIAANKLVLGMPIYGRSFEDTNGIGESFTGIGPGSWGPGTYDFKVLPLDGAIEVYDNTTGSSYSYDATKRELISYDTILVAKQKGAWIKQMDLGGAMWWESSADRLGGQSLIQNVAGVMGGMDGSGLENSTNELNYPNSTYDNVRAGMPDSVSELSTLSATVSDTATLIPPPASAQPPYPQSSPPSNSSQVTSTIRSTKTVTVFGTVMTTTITILSTISCAPIASTSATLASSLKNLTTLGSSSSSISSSSPTNSTTLGSSSSLAQTTSAILLLLSSPSVHVYTCTIHPPTTITITVVATPPTD